MINVQGTSCTQQLGELIRRQWFTEQVTLHGIAFIHHQKIELFPVSHSLGDGDQIQFMGDITIDASGASVVSSIIDIAHNLNLSTIAEGVETREQLKFLISCGCDTIQGYLFSKPLPADEFARLLAEERSLQSL